MLNLKNSYFLKDTKDHTHITLDKDQILHFYKLK